MLPWMRYLFWERQILVVFITSIVTDCLSTADTGGWGSTRKIPSLHLSKISTPNILRCGKLCERHAMCAATTYDKRDRMCYLHRSEDLTPQPALESNTNGRFLLKCFTNNIPQPKCDGGNEITLPSSVDENGHCYQIKETPKKPNCPRTNGYIYYQNLSLCYKIVTDNIDWDDASIKCKDDGGHLMLVNNKDVNSWLVKIFSTVYSGYKKLHIDGNDKLQNGVFKNYRGEVMEWTAWGNGEPNDSGGNEDCTAISRWHNYMWTDIPCNSYIHEGKIYICQVDTET